jgi:hypothetical protein
MEFETFEIPELVVKDAESQKTLGTATSLVNFILILGQTWDKKASHNNVTL